MFICVRIDAESALSYWNFGLRVGTNPTLPVYCTGESVFGTPDTTPNVDQPANLRPAPSTTSAELQLVELHLSVSRERALEDFPSEPPSPRRSAKMVTVTSQVAAALLPWGYFLKCVDDGRHGSHVDRW